jgi:hypothetical protein
MQIKSKDGHGVMLGQSVWVARVGPDLKYIPVRVQLLQGMTDFYFMYPACEIQCQALNGCGIARTIPHLIF